MPITLSDAHFPLLITTARGVLTDDEYREHLDDCTVRIVERGERYAYVYDGSEIQTMTAIHRRMQSDWITRHEPVIRELNQGCGFVFSSTFTRGMLTAVHWVSPPPYPYTIVAQRQQGITWCLERLERAGVPLPDDVASARTW